MLWNREVREEITNLWCLTWYVAPKVSMKTNLAMNQCYNAGVPVAAAQNHKGWHEQRRQRVCSLPLGECFSEFLSRPKHTQLWWLSRWLPRPMHAFVPRRISCCQRWQEVMWWCCPGTECGASDWFFIFCKRDGPESHLGDNRLGLEINTLQQPGCYFCSCHFLWL